MPSPTLRPTAPGYRLLVVTGDARPGNNDFNLEIATIRRACESTPMHVAVGWAVEGTTTWVSYDEVAAALVGCPAPTLTVLNICASSRLARGLQAWSSTVVCWPDLLDDDQARIFSSAFYRSILSGTTVALAVIAATSNLALTVDDVGATVYGSARLRVFE
jgi:hypothetical protein